MTILLIEDDAVEILKFNRSLVKLGEAHELIEAHNGEIALGLLAENSQIDLILLDLNMPKMNGLEFLKQYHEAVSSSDLSRIASVVHKLKNKISMLGLESSYLIAQEYEESLKQNRTSKKENFEKILTLMTNFINSF